MNRAEPFRTGGPSPWTEHLCGSSEACCPNAICWRAPSHEQDHDRFVIRPSSNHPSCTCASSSDSSAREASRSNESCASRSVCGPGTTRRPQAPALSFVTPSEASGPPTAAAPGPLTAAAAPGPSTVAAGSPTAAPPCYHPPWLFQIT